MDSIELKSDSGKLELAVCNYIQPKLVGICDFVKAGAKNPSKTPDTSVYCNAPIVILNLDAIAKTTMRVEIYVKKNGGFKDSAKISEIRNIIVPLLKGVTLDDSYFVAHVSDITGDDNTGFDFTFLNLAVTII